MNRRAPTRTALVVAQICVSASAAFATPNGITIADRAALRVLASASTTGEAGQASAAPDDVTVEACNRKVTVVYSGYGEAERVACPPVKARAGG